MKKYKSFIVANSAIPEKHLVWPLYGAGVDKLGKDGAPIERPIPTFSSNELLMRIDAVSLCYTDVKEIKQGSNHPRLTGRDLETNPIVPGHEISMTVVGVGDNLSSQYKIGDRYTIQPDVWVDGKSIPFCFGMDGGYRQYAKIGKEILEGDAGNYLISIPDKLPYAAAAITEPWACVEASYRMQYRDGIKNNGSVLFCGCEHARHGFSIEGLFEKNHRPSKITVGEIPDELRLVVNGYCNKYQIDFVELPLQNILDLDEKFDDIILLDCSANIINSVINKLKKDSILAICNNKPLKEPVQLDLGNLHYDNIVYVGTTSLDIENAYKSHPVRTSIKVGGNVWFLGAGGPMGRMHVQRAIELRGKPKRVFATNRGVKRLQALRKSFINFAKEQQVEFVAFSPAEEKNEYTRFLEKTLSEGGFDDIEVMVTNVNVIEDSIRYLATEGTLNLFAGIRRGVKAQIDAWDIYGPKQIRLIGHSGSGLDDQKEVVKKAMSGELNPELSVAAVGGIKQIADGIRAMQEKVYPGKIVIYPHIMDYPLTSLDEFREKDPEVFAALGKGETWTKEAEAVFLNKELQ
ncbi:MAG: alcohol dehydrogenase catalytic domain-containing protein [Anaerolineaceae bacterium]|nr:alcohol dehydrogenase catalytic domain-containing protein [Anaerolineaceae bacterium]